jgi:hypothetical protein
VAGRRRPRRQPSTYPPGARPRVRGWRFLLLCIFSTGKHDTTLRVANDNNRKCPPASSHYAYTISGSEAGMSRIRTADSTGMSLTEMQHSWACSQSPAFINFRQHRIYLQYVHTAGHQLWPTCFAKGLAQVTAGYSRVPFRTGCGTLRSTGPNLCASTPMDDMTAPTPLTAKRRDFVRPDPEPPILPERLVSISRTSALEEMASGIAHELNQPLGAIVTFAQAGERILNRPDTSIADAREVFHLISKEALGAAVGIRNIRRLFSRDNFAMEPRDIGLVLRELTAVLKLLAPQTGAELIVNIGATLPLVSIDSLRIQHVLFTLAPNAFEATGTGAASTPRGGTIGFESRERHGTRFWFRLPAFNEA